MGTSLDAIDPDLRQGYQELTQLCAQNGIITRLTSTLRTRREQQFLYNRYVQGLSTLPAVPPLHSAHEYGWAFDMVVSPISVQEIVGGWWQTYWGGTYGGKKDPVHFELPGAGAYAFQLGEQQNPVSAPQNNPTLWDYAGWGMSFTSLASLLLELGYVASSEAEAEKIARALHIDPHGRVF